MKTMKYYGATLIGKEPKAVLKVFSFSCPSQRNQWILDGKKYPRVSLNSRLAKKHPVIEMVMSGYGDEHVWLEVK